MLAIVPAIYRKLADRRRSQRQECSLHAVLTLGNGQRVAAELIEFSRSGFRLVPRQQVGFPGGTGLIIEIADYIKGRRRPLRVVVPARLLRRLDGIWAGDFRVPLDDDQYRRLVSAA